MKSSFIFWVIILELINLSISLVPIWDIGNSSIVLNPGDEITIHYKKEYPAINLTKTFINENEDVKDQNYISVNNNQKRKTGFEDIGKSNYLKEWGNILCPYGRNFLQYFHENENSLSVTPDDFIKDNNINDEDEWELSCYHIGFRNFYFQLFLEQEKIHNLYGYYYKNNNPSSEKQSLGEVSLLDFILTDQSNTDNNENSEFNMFSLYLKNSKIYANKLLLTINKENQLYFNDNDDNKLYLDFKKDYSYAYFNPDTNLFYWVSTSKDNNYSSGISKETMTKEKTKVSLIRNNTSPLQFLQNVTINKIKMIRNTRFAYYEVISKDDNNKYYGIIDIEMNQVIFNTNITLKTFKPLKNDSMLAITEDNHIYRICLNKEDEQCVVSCSEDKRLILDSEGGNFCGYENQQNCQNYLLIPDKICVHTCNTSVNIILNDGSLKKCGLCKDLNESNPYKIYGKDECLKEKPNGTFYLSEEFKILKNCNDNCEECESFETCTKCIEGFIVDENGKCIQDGQKCHPNCENCTGLSDDIYNQKCISCNNEYKYFHKNISSCFDLCIDGFYQDKNNEFSCLKCHETCKKCQKGKEEENENCEECQNDNYLINEPGFPKNCVQTCPEGLNISGKYCKSIINNGTNDNDSSDKNDDDEDNKSDYMLWIFIILFAIILLIVFLCIFKRHCSRNKNEIEIINDINTELQENHRIMD